jgi:GNAT superfamily N-acetyltransferase
MPTGSELRMLRADDAEAVAALFLGAFGDARKLDPDEIRWWLQNDELDPEDQRVMEVEGRIVGYGDIMVESDTCVLDVAAPETWDAFLGWAEETARDRALRHVRTQFPPDHEAADIAARRGYRQERISYTMEITLDDPEPASLPGSLTLRGYREGIDEELVRTVLNDAFVDHPFFQEITPSAFREFHLKGRGYDPSLWFLAWDEDELAGIALAFPERNGDTNLAWVSDLGVMPSWRRQGLGEALLRNVFHRAHLRGIPRVGLGVDVANPTGALRLYERVGMAPVSQQNTWMLDL